MTLGSKIRNIRIQKGLTQHDLGSGVVTPSMISQIESDKANPSYRVLEAIAEKLETPLDYFLSDIQTQLEQSTIHRVAKALISSRKYESAAGSLRKILEKPSAHLKLLEAKYDLAVCYSNLERFEEALELITQVHELASTNGDPVATIRAYNLQGQTEQKQHKYHRAIYYWHRARDYFSHLELPEPYIQSEVLKNLGDVHQSLGENKEALTYYNEAHALLARSSYTEQTGNIYLSLGMGYQKLREYEKAAEYAQYAQAIYESVKNIKFSIDVKRLHGVLEGEDGNFDKAFAILHGCISDYRTNGYEEAATAVHGDIAALYLRFDRYEDCISTCNRVLEELPPDSPEVAIVWRTLGSAQAHLDMIDEAIQSLDRAAVLFDTFNRLGDLADAYSTLGALHEKNGNLEKANECLQSMKRTLEENMRLRGLFL